MEKTHFENKITQIKYSPKPIELILGQVCVGPASGINNDIGIKKGYEITRFREQQIVLASSCQRMSSCQMTEVI